jgi:hypothetical protein
MTEAREGGSENVPKDEIRALAATGVGGIPVKSLLLGASKSPDFIGCDMGTIDLGPHYLGSGETAGITDADLDALLGVRNDLGVPLLAGSAGIAGARFQLENVLGRTRAVLNKNGWGARIATIDSEVDPQAVHDAIDEGRMRSLGPIAPLTHEDVDAAVRIVGQIGPEPYIAALEQGADIVLGGRACDTSPFVALPMVRGFDVGLAYHMAKIIECVSLAAVPGGRDCILGTLKRDQFTLESQNPMRKCTPLSIAAHSLYEQPNPYFMVEPGGTLDTREAEYIALDDRIVAVQGSRWHEAEQYTIKLEGVRRTGHRYFCIAGARDPGVIQNLPAIEATVRATIDDLYAGSASYQIAFRVYGRDGVMGERDPDAGRSTPHEVCVLIEVVAETRVLAKSICALAKQNSMHCGFDGRISTAGNFAFPFSPEIHDGGEAFEFNVYHTMAVDNPLDLSRVQMVA